MAGTLRFRLARARELARTAQAAASTDHSVSTSQPVDAGALGTELGIDSRTPPTVDLSGWSEIAPFLLFRSLSRENSLPMGLDMRPYLGGAAVNSEHGLGTELISFQTEHLLFFDLETTGLSGGAGTIAFLAAFGRTVPGLDGGMLEIRQYLLTDYPGEGGFLDAILNELKPGDILASYNGRSFDEPLLRARCVLNRRTWPFLRHADFLHAARRLWRRRFPDCSLGTLERLLLGRSRILDISSADIPAIWFEFINKGFHPKMEAVVEHNAVDIESLAAIAAECSRIHASPAQAEDCDLAVLGTLWLGLDAGIGLRTLERAFSEGDEKAGWVLLKHYRRGGERADYERILAELPPSWDSWVERAKHAEHRCCDAEGALEAARRASPFADEAAHREALERRLARLERKIEARPPPEGRTILPR